MTKLEAVKLETKYDRLKTRYKTKTKEVDDFIENWLSKLVLKVTGILAIGYVLGRITK